MIGIQIEDLIRLFLIIGKDVVSIFINSIIKNKNNNQNNNNSKKNKINNQEFQKEYDHITYDTDEDYHYDPKEIIYDQDLGYTEQLMKFKREAAKLIYDTDKGYELRHGIIKHALCYYDIGFHFIKKRRSSNN
ncbi:hypothetical protein DICPUDRAFT_83351 [Dictyostelium purpureum]|uniref:Uncharacterized protein n=1 Tax=Dictyostelium purpureum TaxID=5786 RepID=F0ZZA2_DICPU|nr:uncharacterized protein DICPUDRAFT_83351 [Dictyostelium purpureum]EGC30733.1 hypothetical protein DICPUDRAFT_83351 [Dictyostelium purpureum]|eukprot:XP_003292744.1 hypothetical protein DICPUDRAFT_83351 [Dictyostelium purpureum]